MKRLKCIITAAVIAAYGALPLYSLAAENEDGSGHCSFSTPRFSLTSSGELRLSPAAAPSSGGGHIGRSGRSSGLPSKFDLRKEGGVTSVKSQGSEGTCWAHSAVGSAEMSMIKYAPDIDLSEYHAAFYAYYGDDQMPFEGTPAEWIDNGGNCFMAANIWSQWIGPVTEKRLPYGDLSFYKDKQRTEELKRLGDYHLRNAYLFDYDSDRTNFDSVNERVKELVYSGIGVDMSFQADLATYYSPQYNSTRSVRKPKHADHSVVVVGWDDDFSKNNFKVPAGRNGAWLVKNSWGTDVFDGGYMWISYDDRSICEFAAYELEDSDEYACNFHHDTYTPVQTMSTIENGMENAPSYAANVFTTDKTVQVEAVSTYIWAPDTEYEITVYSGLKSASDPVSGVPSAVTSGISADTGMLTIPLDEDVVVDAGSFSVVVKLYCEDTPYVVPIESALYVYDKANRENITVGIYNTCEQLINNTGKNESFFSSDGVKWDDVTSELYTYSESEKAELLEQVRYDLFDDIYPEETALLTEAETAYNNYKSIFSRGTLNLKIGNVPIKALANPVNTVDFSHPSGVVPTGEKVALSVKSGEQVWYSVNGGALMPYTAPVEVNGLTKISATTDKENFTARSYIPSGMTVKKGDVDGNGRVDAADASAVLVDYSSVSTGKGGTLPKALRECGDMDSNGRIDAADASAILIIYSINSTGGSA